MMVILSTRYLERIYLRGIMKVILSPIVGADIFV
jgi:hypothetical protein